MENETDPENIFTTVYIITANNFNINVNMGEVMTINHFKSI